MCGRYYLEREQAKPELEEILERLNRRGVNYKTGEIFPTDTVPVVANSRSLTPTPFAMQWGYLMPDGKRLINARSETVLQRPLFQDGIRQRRCIIPAQHYFEWGRTDRVKYAIRPLNHDLLYLAGIYRLETTGPVFSVLTRAPADEISFIHDRMPVMLDHDTAYAWLKPGAPVQELLREALQQVAFQPIA